MAEAVEYPIPHPEIVVAYLSRDCEMCSVQEANEDMTIMAL
jgi:hypothetical protein